jgi:peptidyl-dipeptidase A
MDVDVGERARRLVEGYAERARPLERRLALATWGLASGRGVEAERELAAARTSLALLHGDPLLRGEAARLDRQPLEDEALGRRVRRVHVEALVHRAEPRALRAAAELHAELAGMVARHRPELHGELVDEDELFAILRAELDEARRRAAWEATRSLGARAAPRLLELARLRNGLARASGFRDWLALSLFAAEIDELWLLDVVDALEDATREPFREEKLRIDAETSAWLGVPIEQLRPWHYQDGFLREAPTTPASSLEPELRGRDAIELAARFLEDLGLDDDVRALVRRGALAPGPAERAVAVDVDREGDVRVLCPGAPGERALEAALRGLGRASHLLGVDRSLPWDLRAPHALAVAATGALFARRTRDPEFLARYVRPRTADERALDLDQARRRALLFARWAVLVARFERELYAEPAPDRETLGRAFWRHVESIQLVAPPPDAGLDDWAAEPCLYLERTGHLGELLGELAASQLERSLHVATGRSLTGNRPAAELLRARWLSPGGLLRWDELVLRASGEPLSEAAFLVDFVS